MSAAKANSSCAWWSATPIGDAGLEGRNARPCSKVTWDDTLKGVSSVSTWTNQPYDLSSNTQVVVSAEAVRVLVPRESAARLATWFKVVWMEQEDNDSETAVGS